MRELRPVRGVGIPDTAVAVPPRAPKMAPSERTAEHDTLVLVYQHE